LYGFSSEQTVPQMGLEGSGPSFDHKIKSLQLVTFWDAPPLNVNWGIREGRSPPPPLLGRGESPLGTL